MSATDPTISAPSGNSTGRPLPAGWTLAGRNFLVTGGTKGIGLAIARSLLEHGASRLVICSRNADECLEVQTRLMGDFPDASIYGVSCDVSTAEGRARLVREVEAHCLNELDGLCNNVGVNVRKTMSDQTEEEYGLMMRTNLDSAYFLCKGMMQALKNAAAVRDSASVVNVSSAAGVGSTGTGAVYGMSKAAMIHMSRILACEWAGIGVRVNSVAPWMTMTPMLQDAVKDDPGQLKRVKEWTPMHRLPTVEEVAGPITYLMMPSSRYVTGQLISVDGGLSAQAYDGPCVTPPIDYSVTRSSKKA